MDSSKPTALLPWLQFVIGFEMMSLFGIISEKFLAVLIVVARAEILCTVPIMFSSICTKFPISIDLSISTKNPAIKSVTRSFKLKPSAMPNDPPTR